MSEFVLVPPPNITGSLHLGHYFCFTIAYIYAKYFDLGTVSGLDHAGVSAVLKVDPLRTLQVDQLHSKLYKWSAESRDMFFDQYRVWDVSFDKSFFSLEDRFQKLAKVSYFRLKIRGYITRQLGFLNYEIERGNVISDAEVKVLKKEVDLFYIRYRSVDDPDTFLTVATTRPETIFNDVALCVHPEDKRYTSFSGREFYVPVFGHRIRLTTSSEVKSDFGTGILKVTPRYDPKDLLIAQTKGLPLGKDIFDDEMTCEYEPFKGMGYDAYTERLVALLSESNEILKTLPHTSEVPHFGYLINGEKRLVKVIQSYRKSMFLDLPKLADRYAKRLLDETEIHPYWARQMVEDWLANISPWCLSRRISWGVEVDFPGVLDTWFNASLWPIFCGSDRGYYLFNTLITGWDLIFFWFIKMCLMSYVLLDRPAFRRVYFMPLIADPSGKKMSKTSGNVVSPDHLVRSYGTDTIRLTLLYTVTPYKYIFHEVSNTVERLSRKIYSIFEFLERRGGDVSQLTVNSVDHRYFQDMGREFKDKLYNFQLRGAYNLVDSFVKVQLSKIVCEVEIGHLDGTLIFALFQLLDTLRYITPDLYSKKMPLLREYLPRLSVLPYSGWPLVNYRFAIIVGRITSDSFVTLYKGYLFTYIPGLGNLLLYSYERR